MKKSDKFKMSIESRMTHNVLAALGCAALIRAYKKIPTDLYLLSEEELEARAKPTKVAHDLRATFIKVFHQALLGRRGQFSLTELCELANCSYAQGYNLLVERPEMLVWVTRPIGDIPITEYAMIHQLVESMSDLIWRPHEDKNGQLDYKLINLKLKIYEAFSPKIGLPLISPDEEGVRSTDKINSF